MTIEIQVLPLKEGLLAGIAQNLRDPQDTAVPAKAHFKYLEEYLDHISAKTVVVEDPYIDQHFLEDYAGYYVRCFSDYKKTCVRLHFFSAAFERPRLDSAICNADAEGIALLKRSYLGFIVFRPLPSAIFGRTCLATYRDTPARSYPILRKYEASLCGLTLTVESLAFQEQDNVTAACATSALWSAFQGTGKLFQHRIPSPVEITRMASDLGSSRHSRVLPNDGLNAGEIARAVQAVGMEPYLVSVEDSYLFKATVYAYIRAKLPMILGADLVKIDGDNRACGLLGKHAIAITGYRIATDITTPVAAGGRLALRALCLSRMYAHDDQVGPFSKLKFQKMLVDDDDGPRHIDCLESSGWAGHRLMPEIVVIPLYHKIRVPFTCAYDFADKLTAIMRTVARLLLTQGGDKEPDKAIAGLFIWDIYLSEANDLKSDIRADASLLASEKSSVLFSHFPRYLWRCICYVGGAKAFEIVLDATDFAFGKIFNKLIVYDSGTPAFLSVFTAFISIHHGAFDSHSTQMLGELFAHLRLRFPVSATT